MDYGKRPLAARAVVLPAFLGGAAVGTILVAIELLVFLAAMIGHMSAHIVMQVPGFILVTRLL